MDFKIIAHHVMKIKVVITRGIAYATITVIIAGVYIGLIALADKSFGQLPAYNPTLVHGFLFILVFFALIIVLPQMKIRAIEVTRRALFRGRYDYQQELSKAIRVIPTMLNLEKLGNYVLEKIRDTMMVDKLALLVRNETQRSYSVLTSAGLEQDTVSKISIAEDSVLTNLLRNTAQPLVKDDLERTGTVPGEEGEEAIRHFNILAAELCVPLLLKGDLVGILALGDKRGGEMYSKEDLLLLHAIASQVTLTIEYIRAVDKLSSEKRYVGLGKASMRMAHDIKNPLVPLKTFLQILPHKYPEQFKQMSKIDAEFTGRFYASALEGVDRINHLIERTLHYARHPEPVFSEVKLDNLLDEALIQEEVNLKAAKIKLRKQYNSVDNNIKADSEQLIELFSNLIGNGIDAMGESPVKILTVRTQALDGGIAAEITDTGCGIPKDRIDTIFDPFITYKHKGSGLGLAIVKKIVDDHQGTIELNSRPDKGTTFRVVLPKNLNIEKPETRVSSFANASEDRQKPEEI